MDPVVAITPLCIPNHEGARSAFAALLRTSEGYVAKMGCLAPRDRVGPGGAFLGRIRATGPGVSFGALVDAMRESYPVVLHSPFEGSSTVAGAVLHPKELLDEARDDAMLLLRFEAGSADLPMHAHEHSERFIYVVSGRGYFHLSSDPVTGLSPPNIRHVPMLTGDALMFRRGTVHTFSTDREPLLLLSYHGPFVPLDDPAQYTIAQPEVCPASLMDPSQSTVSFDAAWNRL